MFGCEPLLLEVINTVLVVVIATCRDYVVLLVSFIDQIIQVRSLKHIVVEGRRSSNITHGQAGLATLDSLVAAMDFGPSFFEDNWPEFALVSLRKGNLFTANGDQLINDNLLLHAVFSKPHAVNAFIIYFLVNE